MHATSKPEPVTLRASDLRVGDYIVTWGQGPNHRRVSAFVADTSRTARQRTTVTVSLTGGNVDGSTWRVSNGLRVTVHRLSAAEWAGIAAAQAEFRARRSASRAARAAVR